MQSILAYRWRECVLCLQAPAPLAATVMMGGLLEAILLARINREPDKSRVFKANKAPKDLKGSTRSLKDWTLSDYIKVSHELRWISVPVKDVGEVLRDYRNYIHPYKQFIQDLNLSSDDASLFWDVTKNITRQIIKGQD
jgi:hypothetical protein